MAAKNAQPANSSDSENEWTFIDTYDGTIETRKNCVTYRKPTYSEAVRGVSEEELAEVESEPEFEVLASFQFRSKGESFGIGSSVTKTTETPSTQTTASSDDVVDDQGGRGAEDDILVISKPEKPVCMQENSDGDDDHDEENNSSRTDDAIVVVDEGFSFDDTLDDDDDVIDLGESNTANHYTKSDDDDNDYGDNTQRTSFINTSLNKICIYDDEEEPDAVEEQKPVNPESRSPVNKWLLCIDTLESSKDLAWDNLTFNLMNTMPLMMASTSAVDNVLGGVSQNQDSDNSDCQSNSDSSFEPISNSDSDGSSSYDNLDDLSHDGDEIDETALIPKWFFNPNHKLLSQDGHLRVLDQDHSSDCSYDLVVKRDFESTIPDWLFDDRYKEQPLDTNNDFIIPDWFHEPNQDSCTEWNDTYNPIIPEWFYNPNHTTYDETIEESDFSDYSDSDSEYTDDTDFDGEDDSDSVIAIPDWLFSERKNSKHHQEEDSLLFSQLFVDVPTFIILLFLTTALGFSIGHGLTVYFGTQALNRNTKVHAPTPQSNVFPNSLDQRMLTAEEIAKVDLLKLEDEIYRQKEAELLSSHLRHDLKNIHKSLQEKHYRLLRNYKSTEDRLHVSKSMSWFWRLKYDQEKRRNHNSSSVVYLQKQLQRIGALYEKEKKVANRWRRYRMNGYPIKKANNSIERDASKEKIYNVKASLASKYWVKAILSSQEIDWDGFKKRWTKDLKSLKGESCMSNISLPLKRKPSRRIPFVMNKNKQFCRKANDLGKQNLTKQHSNDSTRKHSKGLRNVLYQKVFVPSVLSPAGPPIGPPKMKKRPLKFGPINIDRKSKKKGQTAQRRRSERLKKREARAKVLEIKLEVKELKNVVAELRRERRKAEKEKFLLEASWRNLKREREMLKKEKKRKQKNEKRKLLNVKSKLKRARTKLKTWKSVAVQFKKKAVSLERDLQKLTNSRNTNKDIKSIKRDLKLEKRKLRKQRQDLKTLKNRLRKEHRNYAREEWKLVQKQKKLEERKAPQNKLPQESEKTSEQQSTKQGNKQSKTSQNRRKTGGRRPFKDKRNGKNKKSRWKQKEAFIKYWKNLERTLKEWTQRLNKTVREKSGGKIQTVWNRLQEKFGKLINFNWSKPPINTKKKHKKKSDASLIYEKILAEQRKFDRRKRRELDDYRKRMKPRSPMIIPKKKEKRRKMHTEAVVRKRRSIQRRKYQRELEQLQQWALQMKEKKVEHGQMYKHKKKKIANCAKVRMKPKKEAMEKSRNGLHLVREEESIDESSNLTNTLMLVVQPQFNDHKYEMFTKFDAERKERLGGVQSIMHDITLAQMKHERKPKGATELSIPWDYESVILPSAQVPVSTQKRDSTNDEKNSNKPTPPLLDSSMYIKLAQLGVIDTHKGGSIGLPIPPPRIDPLKIKDSAAKQDNRVPKTWYREKTVETWAPPPGPMQSDGSWFFQRSTNRPEQHFEARSLTKEKVRKRNPSKSTNSKYKDTKGKDNWMLLRASGRAHQRILYEPLNKQSAKDRSKRQSKKTYFYRHRCKAKNKDGSWIFDRANDREEQRLNKDPWYVRRAEGREDDRGNDKDTWFIERGFDRELQRNEEPHEYDDEYDDYDLDDDDDDDYYYDIGFGQDLHDDISSP